MAENGMQDSSECCPTTNEKLEDTSNEEETSIEGDDIDELLAHLPNFQVLKVLRNDTTNKRLALQGLFKGRSEDALIVLEKKTFPQEHEILQQGFFHSEASTTKIYRNDIYRGYDWYPIKEHNGLKATIIYPATQKHIETWSPSNNYLVEETPELYEKVTLSTLLADQFSLQWVDNILNGTAEADRVIHNDQDDKLGFVLVKDLKWDGELQTLYLLAITRQKIRSIRELNDTHLPLLRNIKESGCRAIKEQYNIPSSQLKIFFHYHPSFYHLHVHFTAFGVETAGAIVERAHLLTTVINNIELMPDYYQKATLTFRVLKSSVYEPYEKYLKEKAEANQDTA